ncbi:coiled-coil domain-containing protein 39 [Orussus abietinus]|uniref:coiled-coil domain-containing protein 39 n=1 Tax=Orussus abietinus TaxID=222816 RepID=UPI0006255C38|nr:coiled-coil domain-containing protein 39 [Orussus abietinus]
METHVSTVEEVLEKLGWGDGFRIPVANEENRRLQLEIERKTEHKSSLSNELEKLEGRVTKIAKHLNLVALEHGLNQKLLTAHSGQLDAEEHLYRLAENTRSNVRQSARQLQKEKKDLVERISLVESEITKLSAKLKASKTTAEFEKDRLLRWEEILQREDERNQLINRYAKLDEKKFKELELKRQKLEVELKELRGTVFSTFDDVHEMEIFLDRTAKAYVDALSERRRLIDQWSQSVLVLRQRDNGIQDAVREIDTLKEIGREKVDAYNEAVQFFEHQVADNKQLEELIRQLEKKHAMVKDEYRGLLDTIGVYRNEYGTQKKYLEDLSRRAQSMRVKTKKKRFDIESKFLKVEELRKQNNDLRKTFEEISSQQLSIAEREKQFEDMLQREERRKHLIMKETSRIEGLNLRATNRENELESERKALEIRNQAEHKKVNVLAAFHLKEEKRLKDKKEEIYRFDFEIQQCEARLARLTGQDCDKTETDKKQKAFDDLRNVFNEKTEIAKLLQAQITNLEVSGLIYSFLHQ